MRLRDGSTTDDPRLGRVEPKDWRQCKRCKEKKPLAKMRPGRYECKACHEWENLTGACARCNRSKRTTSLLSFLARRMG